MDRNSDSSMLSDELKPRRTPVPSSFGDTVPRPSVPDLSIIETPSAGAIGSNQNTAPVAVARAQSSLNHLSYNDWRQQTGVGAATGSSSNNPGRRSIEACLPSSVGAIQKPPNAYVPAGVERRGHVQENVDYRKVRIEEPTSCRPQPSSGSLVSYTDFTSRPTSAPAPRTLPVDPGIGREHPLSKSAPLSRSPGQVQSSNRQKNSTPASVDPNNYPHQVQLKTVPTTQYTNGHSSDSSRLHDLSLIPSSNFNSQQPEARRLMDNSRNGRPQYDHRGHEFGHASKNMINHGHIPYSEVPSHHVVPPPGGQNMYMYPGYPGYYHAMKPPGPWPYAEHSCCPAAPSAAPAVMSPRPGSQLHSVPANPPQPNPHSQVSFDDLYKIVLAQNDQLKALQSQVERLLLTQDHKPPIEAGCKSKDAEKLPVAIRDSNSNMPMEEGTQTSDCEQQDKDCQKMSIGVMTSFIHAVTYRGRVERLDAVHNVSEHESVSSNGNLAKQNKSSSSDDCSSSSMSPAAAIPQRNSGCTNCCKDCTPQTRQNEKLKKRNISKNGKSKQNPRGAVKEITSTKAACPEGCNCNNPGVSAAITAVRGCQAVLASRAGVTGHEYSIFNGADLPTLPEQPVSPMSSIHVDLHDYRSSSSDEESGSLLSEESASSAAEGEMSPTKEEGLGPKPNGWTFYNNVLGQVNRILDERDSGDQILDSHNPKAMQHHKSTDVSVSKRVAFEAHGVQETPKHLKEMALKYLRENHPEELASNISSKKTKKPHGEKLQEMAVYNMPASNMSFATFRYLERYNLLPENFNPEQYLEASANVPGCHKKPQDIYHNPMPNTGSRKMAKVPSGKSKLKPSFPQTPPDDVHYQLQHMGNRHPNPVHRTPPRKPPQFNTPTSKILDITTLRQQPKLL